MNKSLNKIAITGATGGIGSAIAQALDLQGYELLLTGRDAIKLNQLLSSLSGDCHAIVVADLATLEGANKLKVAAEAVGISGLINCLGSNQLATLQDTNDEDISALISINLLAPIRVCKALQPILACRPKAMIVNVGSILGSIGYAGSSVYCATKFGLKGFSESLRRELSDTNIAVVYLAPRATQTSLNTEAMNQMNKALGNAVDQPEQVAEQIIRILAAGKSDNRYMGWPESFFVKLNSLLPGLVDDALSKQLPTIKRYCVMNHEQSLNRN
jgi:short-subunit dehydrogenase